MQGMISANLVGEVPQSFLSHDYFLSSTMVNIKCNNGNVFLI